MCVYLFLCVCGWRCVFVYLGESLHVVRFGSLLYIVTEGSLSQYTPSIKKRMRVCVCVFCGV